MSADGGRAPDRRKVSLRWLAGTILTGLFGAGLMGGAVYAALDGEYSVASVPQIASTMARDNGSQTSTKQKSDRILIQTDTIEAHQVIRVSTTTKVGDKDVIKVKPFARVLASLQLASGSLASQVPGYDPQALVADPDAASAPPVPAQPAPADDGEVTVANHDLADVTFTPASGPLLPDDQVLALVRSQAGSADSTKPDIPPQFVALSGDGDGDADSPDLTALRETDVPGDPDSALKITIVPENFTNVSKTAAETSSHEQTILVEDKDTLASVLGRLGSTDGEVEEIAKALGEAGHLHGGLRLRVLVAPGGENDDRPRPVRLSVYNADQHLGTVVLSDTGDYVSVQDPTSTDIAANAQDNQSDSGDDNGDDDTGTGIRLYYSIYETALKQQVPKEMIERLLRIYAFDVDLTRHTRPGDNFELFYEQDDNGKPIGDILYTALTVGGDLKRYYRFQSPDDGQVDYYDEDGKSARKFLLRKPINGGEMRSTFGMRRHPILGYYKMHTGVDWADKIGTPIISTGNGTIVKAGWTNGYGRHIEIQHANGYMTTYSHMSGFAASSVVGAKVKMGQVIGYLGMTGLATGPHIHYEVKINDSFVDPMRIKLPQGRELNGALLAAFKDERSRIDGLMSKAPVAEVATGNNRT